MNEKDKFKSITNKSLQLISELEKVSPGLGGYVLNEAEAEGIPPEEIIARAIQFKALVQEAVKSRLTVDQLLATFDLWDAIYRRALQSAFITTQLWGVMAQVFSGFMELYSNVYAAARKAADESGDAEVKKEMLRMWRRMMKNMQEAMKMVQGSIVPESVRQFRPYTAKATEVRKNEEDR